ncbi:MAG: outer membrane protein assembly factor BamD [Gemmataceae bacterium]|nr:outer membrane protein assembly factor BamD [Gemmataceae bacterium]
MTKDECLSQDIAAPTAAFAARARRQPPRLLWLPPLAICLLTGCATASWDWLPWRSKTAQAPATGPKDSFVMRGDDLERTSAADSPFQAELDAAKRLLQNQEYRQAERAFHKLANNKKAPLNLVDEALFLEAECQRLQNNLRDAEGTYRKYVKTYYRTGQFVESANRRLFEIANYWLEDTRKQMLAWEEQRDGKRLFVLPTAYFHVSKDKPFLDMEGHALQILEELSLADIKGAIRTVDGGPSIGEQALFYLATVKFFRKDYREADSYYSQLYERYPNSPMAPKAIKQSIICKQIMNGGTDYDTRTIEEARKLIDRYQTAYPEWNKDREWLTRQLGSVHLQQADRDFKIAEFYRRTSHPGSAFFYYELVKRRYPNTEYARKAEERMRELRDAAARDHGTTVTTKTVTAEAPNAFTPPGGLPPLAAAPDIPAAPPSGTMPPSAASAPSSIPAAQPTAAAPAPVLPPTILPPGPIAGPGNSPPPSIQEPVPIAPSSAPRLLPPGGM